jgi:hypothetical protein
MLSDPGLSALIFAPPGQKFRFYQPFGLAIIINIYMPPFGGMELSLALVLSAAISRW